jgi:hypothetical protein
VRATPTPRQQWALETLGYLAPLLRLMRCEVLRAVYTTNEARGTEQTTFLAGPGDVPLGARPLIDTVTHLLVGGWLRDPGDEAAVNFDTASGLIDAHRHYQPTYTNVQFRVPDGSPDRPRFAQPLGPLFTGTLDAGGAAVLADWFDEQSADWSAFAAAVRTWMDFIPTANVHIRHYRYAVTSPDTACWLFRAWEDWRAVNERAEAWVIGLGVFGPDGLERMWHLTAPPSDDPEFHDQLWDLFPAPPRVAQ